MRTNNKNQQPITTFTCVTVHTMHCRFLCDQWLDKNQGDGRIERLLRASRTPVEAKRSAPYLVRCHRATTCAAMQCGWRKTLYLRRMCSASMQLVQRCICTACAALQCGWCNAVLPPLVQRLIVAAAYCKQEHAQQTCPSISFCCSKMRCLCASALLQHEPGA